MAGATARVRLAGALLIALACALPAACSINPPLELGDKLPPGSSLLLEHVPFYPQQAFQCGPAALAGALGAAGIASSPASLAPRVYLPGREGSLQAELMAATRRAGAIPYPVDTSPQALFAQLRQGSPVLVLQNLQTRSFPVWHYALVVGYEVADNTIYLNSGTVQNLEQQAPAFLRTWDWAGRWGMVALTPGSLPAQVDAGPYLQAVADFEQVAGAAAATPAWRAALRAWPQHPGPYLALGNQAYASGRLLVALHYYQRGLQAGPENPALGNNLATVMGELGCPRAGLALLEPLADSLSPESAWRPSLAITRAELESVVAETPSASESGLCTLLGRL